MKKRILSIILAAVMLIAALPFNAFALSYGTETEISNRELGINMWGFTSNAKNYISEGADKATDAEKLEEIEDVLAEGYVNQLLLPTDSNFEATIELCKKYDCDFWIGPGYYNSKNQTIENYIANVEYNVNRIRAAGAYDRLLGFIFDEPLWAHNMTNDELYTMTKALYEKWGKRNYVVFAVGSIIDGYYEVNNKPEYAGKEQLTTKSAKYITDAGWDNYGLDVSDEALKNQEATNYFASHNANYGTNIKNAKEYYEWTHNEMMEKFDHDVYTWFYPCAYNRNSSATETYCLNHLNYFKELLDKQEKPGGISLYTYATYSTAGLEQFLPVNNIATNTQKLYPDVTKWTSYATRLKEIKTEFDSEKLSTLDDMTFGSLDVADATHNTITINANDGYEYSIDGGEYQTSGTFTGLKASTAYTITVKRTSDSKTKDFTVSTTARYPYSTGLGDTASYAIKMPTHLNYYGPTYGWVGAYISRNIEDSDWLYKDDGTYKSDGYLHLETDDNGERFLKVQNSGSSDANTSINLSFGDEGRANSYKGVSKGIDTDNLSAFAIRMKTEGGTDDQLSIFDFYLNISGQDRTDNASKYPIQFLDKETLTVSTLTYSGGINITGNVDGWIIVPFDAYGDIDNDSTTTNRETIVNNITSIQLWQHEENCGTKHYAVGSNWDDKIWYVGDVMYVENTAKFIRTRRGISEDLPEGTIGKVMDVPETEQYINYKTNGILYFNQWHGNFLMKKDAASEADPFNTPVYNSGDNNNGGGLYVKNLDGESYIVFNPKEIVNTVEYADGTNDVSYNKYGNSTHQTLNASNGKMYFNNISTIENEEFAQNAIGLSSIDNTFESEITHIAFRIKVVGGYEGQQSVFHLYRRNMVLNSKTGVLEDKGGKFGVDYKNVQFVDAKTGESTKNSATDTVICLPEGDFDGYMLVPLPETALTQLIETDYIHIYTFASASEYHAYSDWTDRSLCFGDIYAVDDATAFTNQFIPDPVAAPDDTAIDIFTVPEAGSKIYHTNVPWGLGQYTTSDGFKTQTSIEENGERFFPVTVSTEGSYISTYLPATYMNGGARDGAEDTIAELYPDLDLSKYNYIAVRFKISGGDITSKPTLWINCGTSGATDSHMTLTGTRFVDLQTGVTTTVESGTSTTVPVDFDGWIIIPATQFETELGAVKRVSLAYRSSSWANRTIYVGDMKIVEDYDAFVYAHGTPDFSADTSEKGKIILTNNADTDNEAVYSVDGENWYSIDEFNDLTFEIGQYTVYAKYPWTAISQKTVSTPSYNYKGVDGAHYYLNVWDEDSEYHFLSETNGCIGYRNDSFCKIKETGEYRTSAYAKDGLYVRNINGETFIELDKRDYKTDGTTVYGDGNINIVTTNITYGAKTYGIDSSIDKTNLKYIALRLNIDYVGDVETDTSIFSIYMNYPKNDGTTNKYEYRENDLENAYLVDNKTGKVVDPGWDGYGYKFEGEFDGWVIIPMDAYVHSSATGKEAWLEKISGLQFWQHDTGCGHGCGTSRWLNKIMYVGDIVVLEDDKKFVCDYLGAHSIEKVEWSAPTAENKGEHYACTICGDTFADAEGTTEVNPALLAFDTASLTLHQNIAINFKANAANLEGFTNVYAKFTYMDGKTRTVKMGDAVNGKHVFSFENIGPQSLGEEITAQLFGTYDGNEYHGAELKYSVKDYCYNKLDEHADDADKNTFKTLLIDLLNYGAKAQIYTGTDTDALVNADLDYYEKKLATLTPPTVNDGIRGIYDDLADEDTHATWNGVNLYFETTVGMKFRFTAESTEGLTVKVMDAKTGGNVLDEISSFTDGANGSLVAYFDKLDATQMRDTVYVAVYKDGVKVSDTLAYSILAYAGQKVIVTAASATDAQKNLASLVSHMMRYGDAAKAYVAA